MAKKKGMTARGVDYPQWYQEVIKGAELAQHAPVKGCMIIRPYGYAIWEKLQRELDERIKDTGHENAYFPLFVPESFMTREAEHVEGFSPECAVVTHAGGEKLEEPLYIRPTSETIIGDAFKGWVQSYRDLPLLINQWANVVRWEKRTRLFLRTSEFLWQEGHTAHETTEEAQAETMQMLEVYRSFAEEVMAMPVITGEKPSHERFAGAVSTYSIEAMMQDRKALQAGTSHNLGQNFSRAFGIEYLSRSQSKELAWTTSWGVSTRLIGGLIMTHGDDQGLVLPPRVAPVHAAIVPIYRKDEERARVMEFLAPLMESLADRRYHGFRLRVKLDDREALRPGSKFFEWERKGVPLRLEAGPRDVEKGHLVVVRRDTGEKRFMTREAFASEIEALLDEIQGALYRRAVAEREANTRRISDFDEFKAFFTPKNERKPEIHGGFVLAHYHESEDAAVRKAALDRLKALKVTVRCLPLDAPREPGHCIISGAATDRLAIYAKSY